MLFHSPEFILLMLGTLGIYVLLPKLRIPLLAAANLFFYGVSGWQYLLLFVAVLTLTHLCAVRVRGPGGKLYLWLAVSANILNLMVFKYTFFAVTNLKQVLHWATLDPNFWQLVLPIGISFYTFHLIAYVVDVYRGEIPPARSLVECWVFTAFFGQLIAGPIMRGKDFLPQIISVEQRRVTWEHVRYGAYLFALGMAKKVLLADPLGERADRLWADWESLPGPACWIAVWLFAFQIYYDFSAYSDMALGIGHLFGFELTANFRTPYLAANPGEFWQRWHITLSSWIRDYTYIPLGGSRKGDVRTYLNLIIAMTLSGLWHGAAWTFVVWGIYHGLLSAIHRFWSHTVAFRLNHWSVRWLSVFLMFQATCLGWTLFRARSWAQAAGMVGKMLAVRAWEPSMWVQRYLPLIVALGFLHLVEFWVRRHERSLYGAWRRWVPRPIRALAYTAVAVLLLVVTDPHQGSFIYFQF